MRAERDNTCGDFNSLKHLGDRVLWEFHEGKDMTNSFAERLQRLADQEGRVVINTMFRAYDWQDRSTWPAPDEVERRMAQFRVMRKSENYVLEAV